MFLQNNAKNQHAYCDPIKSNWQKEFERRNQIEFEIMLKRIKELDKRYQKFNNERYNFNILKPKMKNGNLY